MSKYRVVEIAVLVLFSGSPAFAADASKGEDIGEKNEGARNEQLKTEGDKQVPSHDYLLDLHLDSWTEQFNEPVLRIEKSPFLEIDDKIGSVLTSMAVPGLELHVPLVQYDVSASVGSDGKLSVKAFPTGAATGEPVHTFTETVKLQPKEFTTRKDGATLAMLMRKILQNTPIRTEKYATLLIPSVPKPIAVRGKRTQHLGGHPELLQYQDETFSLIEVLTVRPETSASGAGDSVSPAAKSQVLPANGIAIGRMAAYADDGRPIIKGSVDFSIEKGTIGETPETPDFQLLVKPQQEARIQTKTKRVDQDNPSKFFSNTKRVLNWGKGAIKKMAKMAGYNGRNNHR